MGESEGTADVGTRDGSEVRTLDGSEVGLSDGGVGRVCMVTSM